MIWHQAPGEHFTMRKNVFFYFLNEEPKVSFTKENNLPVVSLVVDVVNITCFKIHDP